MTMDPSLIASKASVVSAGAEPAPTTILHLSRNITIRTMLQSDIPSRVKQANNYLIWFNLRNFMPHPYLVSNAEWFLAFCQNPANWATSGPVNEAGSAGTGPLVPVNYAICINDVDIGSIGLKFGVDVYCRSAEIGYWIAEDHWNKGIMSEVVKAFVEWTWKTFPVLVRLEGQVFSWNKPSTKVLEKAGFESIGNTRCSVWKDGRLGGEYYYELIREGVATATAVG